MNKIVRDHYPVDKLPEDLRVGFSMETTVRVIIEEEGPVDFDWPGFPAEMRSTEPALDFASALDLMQSHRERHGTNETAEQAVARIRALRDEWEDE